MAGPDPYEQSQRAGIEHLLAIAREQSTAKAAARATVPFPAVPTLPLPCLPGPVQGDQIAQLEAEAGFLPLIPRPHSRGRVT